MASSFTATVALLVAASGFKFGYDMSAATEGSSDGGSYAQSTYSTRSISASTIACVAGSVAGNDMNVASQKGWFATDSLGQYFTTRGFQGNSPWPGSVSTIFSARCDCYIVGGTAINCRSCWGSIIFDYCVRSSDEYASQTSRSCLWQLDGKFQIMMEPDGTPSIDELDAANNILTTANLPGLYAHAGTNVWFFRSTASNFIIDSYHMPRVSVGHGFATATGTSTLHRFMYDAQAAHLGYMSPKLRVLACGSGADPGDAAVAALIASAATEALLRPFTSIHAWLDTSLGQGWYDVPGESQCGRRARANPKECWINCSQAGAGVASGPNSILDHQVPRATTFLTRMRSALTGGSRMPSTAHVGGSTNDVNGGVATNTITAALSSIYSGLKGTYYQVVTAATCPSIGKSGAADAVIEGYETKLRAIQVYTLAETKLTAIADFKALINTGGGTASEIRTAMQTYGTNGMWSPNGTTLFVPAAAADSMDGLHPGLTIQPTWASVHNTAINAGNIAAAQMLAPKGLNLALELLVVL